MGRTPLQDGRTGRSPLAADAASSRPGLRRSNVRSLRLGPPAHSLGWTPIVTRQGRRCLHEPPPARRRHAQEATPRHERLPNVPLFSLDAGRLVIARGGFLRCAPAAAGFGPLR